jgi:Tol biopolymer transport system component
VKPSPKAVRTFLFATLFPLILAWSGVIPSASAQTILVTSANPSSSAQGTVNLNVQIGGQGFHKGALAKFFVTGTTDPGGITVNSTSFANSGQLIANINVAQNATLSKFDILVTNTDGRTGKGTELFAVTAPDPAIAYTTSNSTSNFLMVMNADGTNQFVVLQVPKPSGTQSGSTIGAPNWSPDHTQLVFAHNIQGSGIYIINKDGSGLRKVIATNDYFFNDPVWSPVLAADGNYKIAFADNTPALGCHDLYLVNLDGTGLVNLTNSSNLDEFYPTWDTSATRLAGQSVGCNSGSSLEQLYEYNLGLVGTTVAITSTVNLTASGSLANSKIFTPDWAKTQDKIVVQARPLSNLNSSALWIVSLADPANPVELTAATGTRPSWSPDDSKIVFTNGTIYIINPDGSGLASLGVGGSSPDWRRCCPTCVVPCAP